MVETLYPFGDETMGRKNQWSEQEIKFITDNFNKLTYKEMSKQLKREGRSIQYFATTHLGLQKGSGGWRAPKNKQFIHSDYFKTFTEESCYILGFLAADGYVSPQRNRVSIRLSERDIDRLEFIRDEICPNRKLTYNNKTNHQGSHLQFDCKTIKQDLELLGFKDLKKDISNIFEKLPQDYHRDFIRGFFDGDGCISYFKRKRVINNRTYSSVEQKFSFTNNDEQVLRSIQNIIDVGHLYDHNKWGKYFTLESGKYSDVKKLYHYMYDSVNNPRTIMKRKQEKFQDLFRQKG